MAAALCRRPTPPQAPTPCPGASPRRPLPPWPRNRAAVLRNAAAVADSSAGSERRRRRFHSRRPSSSPVDSPCDLLVRLRSSWTLSPSSSRTGAPPPLVPGRCSPWPSCQLLANVACLQMGHGPQQSAALGQFDPSVKRSCCFVNSRK
jgi:hypothetical protein